MEISAKIHEQISKKIQDFEIKTGIKAKFIYLGRLEMDNVLKWALKNDYINKFPTLLEIEGDNRPEINGLKTYLVNEKNHLEIS